jgi:hypothetical protein
MRGQGFFTQVEAGGGRRRVAFVLLAGAFALLLRLSLAGAAEPSPRPEALLDLPAGGGAALCVHADDHGASKPLHPGECCFDLCCQGGHPSVALPPAPASAASAVAVQAGALLPPRSAPAGAPPSRLAAQPRGPPSSV